MPTIYLDVLLLQSLYVNYFLLRAAAKLTHTPLHWIRCGLAAAGSSLFSLLILLPPLPAWFQLVCKLLAAALSVTMAFGLHRESFFRQWGCFFLCNFLLAGAILGIGSCSLPRKTQKTDTQNEKNAPEHHVQERFLLPINGVSPLFYLFNFSSILATCCKICLSVSLLLVPFSVSSFGLSVVVVAFFENPFSPAALMIAG